MDIIDISMPLSGNLASWPGDTRFQFDLAWKRSEEVSVNVGAVTMSTHFGTHIDAPFHFKDDGKKIDELALNPFIGKAVVIDVRGERSISQRVLQQHDFEGASRLLLRTDAWADPCTFPKTIPVMELDVPDWLRSEEIVLVGLDLPSVDDLDCKELPIHHAMARNEIAILESLDLRHVAKGVYELFALPLRIVGADAAPARAALRRM